METSDQNNEARALLQHAAWLRRLAIALVGDSAAAEDLAQETWVAALASGVDSDRPLQPWLRRVATNFAHRSFRMRERTNPEAFEDRLDTGAIDPAELTERLEHESLMTGALSDLDEPFRTTLYLRYYEGFEPKEIAARTQTPGGTVRWRLKRGLELLRERLDTQVEGGRESWMAMLAPLAGFKLKASTTAASGVAVSSGSMSIFGVLAMSTMFKILAALTASALLYVGLDTSGALPPSLSLTRAGEVPVEIEFRPIEPAVQAPAVRAEPKVAMSSPQATTRAPLTAPQASESTQRTTKVLARVTDEYGEPLGAVLVSSGLNNIEVLTGEDGLLQLDVDRTDEPTLLLALSFSKLGRTSATRSLELGSEPQYDFGDIRLDLGGVVSGQIVDRNGSGIEGATITWVEGSVPARRLDPLRFGNVPPSTPTCLTNANGEFALSGVPVGTLRLWAKAAGYEAQFTAVIEIRPRFESRGVNITLPPLKAQNHILLHVVSPAGESIPGAELNFRYTSEILHTTYSGNRIADEYGRYEFVVKDDTQLWVNATDPEELYGASALEDIGTGPNEITLQLTEARFGELTVTRSSGGSVGEFLVEIRSADGELVHEEITAPEANEGLVRYRIPATPFLLHVTAPMAAIAELGPVAPKDAENLSVRLRELPGMHGVVTAGGKPLAHARVTLHQAAARDIELSVDGFRCGYHRETAAAVRTDDRGRFALTVREPGDYVVRAEAEQYAAADTLPFTVELDLRSSPIKLELGRGGVIEGEVRTGTLESPIDTIVGVSRGDTYAQTVRVGHDGKYRFAGLTPGLWRVSAQTTLVRANSVLTEIREGRRVVPYDSLDWDCEVREGQTTFHAVGLAGMANWSFEGNFSVAGDTSLNWNARLLAPGRFFVEDGPGAIGITANGDFKLPVDELGPYQLVLRGELAVGQECFIVHPIDAASDSPWLFDLAVGELKLGGIEKGDGGEVPPLVLIHELPKDGIVLIAIAGDEQGQVVLERAPAGKCRIVRPNPENLNPTEWETIAEIEVPVGGSVQREL